MAELINSSVFTTQKFVDFSGLDYFWSKVKTYVDGADTTLDGKISENSAAIKSIQDELDSLSGGAGSIATQINNAITALNLPTTYETIANVAAIKTELSGAINTAKTEASEALAGHARNAELHVTKDKQDSWDAAVSAINAFLKDSDATEKAVDTLKEIQEYINTDGEASATFLAHINNGDIHVTTADKANWNAAEQNAKDYADNQLKSYYTSAQVDTKLGEADSKAQGYATAAKEAAISAAAEDATTKANTAESNAKSHAEQYTNELFNSISFATNGDIDGIFAKTQA